VGSRVRARKRNREREMEVNGPAQKENFNGLAQHKGPSFLGVLMEKKLVFYFLHPLNFFTHSKFSKESFYSY